MVHFGGFILFLVKDNTIKTMLKNNPKKQKTKMNQTERELLLVFSCAPSVRPPHYIPPPYKKCPFIKISCCPNIFLLLFPFSLRPTSPFGVFTSPHFSVWIFHFAPLLHLDFHFAPLLCLDFSLCPTSLFGFSLRPTSPFGFFTSPHFSIWIFTSPHFSIWIFHFAPLLCLEFHFAPLLHLDFSLRPTSLFGFSLRPTSLFGFFTS